MIEEIKSEFNWFILVAAVLSLCLVIAAYLVAEIYPLDADADAKGRIEELLAWQQGGPTPAQSRGPLHFYLLKLVVPSENPQNPQVARVDIPAGGLFLFFYLLFSRKLFGPWIAVGSGLAVCFHPAFIKSIAAPTGFPLFYFLIFAGFWALASEFDEEAGQPTWRTIFGGLALSLSVFLRFEGGFFLFCAVCLLAIYKRHRQWLILSGAGLATLIVFSLATYFDPISYLRGGTLFVGDEPLSGGISMAEFAGYLLSTFGPFPLLAGIIGAGVALKNKIIRPWAMIFLVYTCLLFLVFARTRFQHDLDRYFLYLLMGFLPFFGFLIQSFVPEEKKWQAGISVMAAYVICIFFYVGSIKMEF